MTANAANVPFGFSDRARRSHDQPIGYLMAKALATPGLISLAAGFVDYQTLPAQPIADRARDILGDEAAARTALQYGTTQGLEPLRQRLFDHLARMDDITPDALPGSPDQMVVTTGSQQALHLLTDVLVNPGDLVLAAWPSYFVYTGALDGFGAVVRGIDMDQHGMRSDSLARLLEGLEKAGQLDRVKIVYTCPDHQNPTGLTMPSQRRAELLEVIRRFSTEHRILLIEDAAYRELTYPARDAPADAEPTAQPASIKSLDRDNAHLALLGTISKPFAPGLKTGYALLPDDLVGPVARSKAGRDFGSANLAQHLAERVLAAGDFDQHLARLRRAYREKRDVMLQALSRELSNMPGVHWTEPGGGLYVWLALPEAVDTGPDGSLFDRALSEGVLYVPGRYCYPPDPTRTVPDHAIRLSFGVPTPDQIDEGVGRLATAIRAVQA